MEATEAPLGQWSLTEKEEETLKEFKVAVAQAAKKSNIELSTSLSSEGITDWDYVRFLRAREFNFNAALEMITACMIWRNEFGVDDITEADVAEEYKKGKYHNHLYDLENRLVVVMKVRKHIASESDPNVLQKLCVWGMEQGRKLLHPDNPTCHLMFDLNGFGLANMDLKFVGFLVKMFSDYYPESLGICLVVDSPFIFWGCWLLIKPFLDKRTASKIFFVKTKDLTKYIAKENLLSEYGGDDHFKWHYKPNMGLSLTGEVVKKEKKEKKDEKADKVKYRKE